MDKVIRIRTDFWWFYEEKDQTDTHIQVYSLCLIQYGVLNCLETLPTRKP